MKLNFYFVECLRGTLLAILFVATLHVSFEANAARLALVIGNDNYEHHPKLRKAGNDADAMAALLKRAGFEVVNDSLRRDLTRLQMNTMFTQLIRRINGGDEVVVFYSGHGLQYGDVSLLTGRDFPKPFERTLALAEAVQLRVWQEEIKRKGARYALFVIDACREDIVDDPMVRSLGEASTLRLAQPPAGQFVLFSASSGQLALDRLSDSDPNPNSVFTRVFLEEAQKPGVAIRDVLEETQERVELLAATVKDRATGLPHRQSPASRNEAGKAKYCLFSQGAQCGVVASSFPAQRVDPEEEAYSVAKSRNTRVAWEALLDAYPQGRYARVARIALAEAVVPHPVQPQTTQASAPTFCRCPPP